MVAENFYKLSQAAKEHIDSWLTKYPEDQKQSAVIAALHFVQEEHDGWLTEEMMDVVADYLDMPKIAVYEVATFYDMYDLNPVGKHKIRVCTNISCLLCGSDNIVAKLKAKLGIEFGQTTDDGKFTLKEVECLAACTNAPMMMIDDTYYENLTPERVEKILDDFKSE